MRTPLLIVSGVDKAAMDSAAFSLLWDLPRSVAVTHSIDPARQVLTRIVSDMSGRLEHEQIELEHACVGCALREDILPTIERLARDGRWTSIVATLPVGAEPDHVSRVVTRDANLAGRVRLASVLVALGPDRIVEDFLGTDRLIDRGLHASPDDVRGLGETIAGMVEYADVIVTTDEVPDPTARDLLRALQRPGTRLLHGTESLDGGSLIDGLHASSVAYAWKAPRTPVPLPPLAAGTAWRVDLLSALPFHPRRMLDDIDRLGGGRHRSRGCFWVPSRPTEAILWDGAGGHLSIGRHSAWGSQPRLTRIILTGVGDMPEHLHEAFTDMLVSPQDGPTGPEFWINTDDGLEPWLGEIPRAA
ncbi:MAG: GTP-binding protein [Actinomycetales bacterium]|nr:GTP-binding protein [Actinomycetales bacterium]